MLLVITREHRVALARVLGYIDARARATKAAPLTCSAYLVTRMHRLLCGNAPTPILCRAERKLTPEFFKLLRSIRVPSAGLAATPGVRSMVPSKRRKTSAVSQPASGNASSGVRTRRSASARGDLPDAPDADLDAEPEELVCPITRTVFRDPVFVVDSGHTYERSAILSHFERNGAKEPLTRRALSSTKVMTNWAMRNVVQAWLDKHPGLTPDGWDSRELLEPSKDDGIQSSDDEGVLRTWRAMCPELQERWPEDKQPEDWLGVTMENGRVVELELDDFGLTGAVAAEIARLSALRLLNLGGNQLVSVPAEIGLLTSLEVLWLNDNQLTSMPAEIWQLTSLRELDLSGNQLTSLPAEIGQLTSLMMLDLSGNQLTTMPAAIRELRAAGCRVLGVTLDE